MLSPVEVRGFSASDVRDVNAAVNRVTPDFFEVFGTRIVAGPGFRETDDRLAPDVAIVNTDFVRRYLPDTEPLGQLVRLGTRDLEIVGVVESGCACRLSWVAAFRSRRSPAGTGSSY